MPASALKAFRSRYKVTQKEIGSLLGVSNRVVCSWEKGTTPMPFDKACQLADIFNVSLDVLRFAMPPRSPDGEAEDMKVRDISYSDLYLSDDELFLLDAYRSLNGEAKAILRTIAEDMRLSKRHDSKPK